MRTLAEPTLTAISGEKATFRVGGEFNVVVGQTTDAGNIIPVSTRSNTASDWNSSRSCCRRAASA
jgi:Flp pilus assembly secretin CpaC